MPFSRLTQSQLATSITSLTQLTPTLHIRHLPEVVFYGKQPGAYEDDLLNVTLAINMSSVGSLT